MDETAVKFTQWTRCDPLEPFSSRLAEKIGPRIPFKVIQGGGEFSTFTGDEEVRHCADLTYVRSKGRNGGLRSIRKVLTWPFSREESPVLLIRRDPDPSCLAEGYSLYIKIENCPEIEETVLSVCEEFRDSFTGGIFVYSEIAGENSPEPRSVSFTQ